MEEIFDIYTREGKYIGTERRSVCHSENPGFYHKPVWIWIINSKNELLIQKRSSKVEKSPNRWGAPSAGHLKAGETILQGAIRETEEELGVKTKEDDYIYVGEFIRDSTWELVQTYLLKLDLELKDFKLQEEEVDEIKWVTFDEFENVFFSEEFAEIEIEYKKLIINYLKKYAFGDTFQKHPQKQKNKNDV